jgi:hypothetical protein
MYTPNGIVVTPRERPDRYDSVKPHGCCRSATKGKVTVVAEVRDSYGNVLGITFENTCCGKQYTPAMGDV